MLKLLGINLPENPTKLDIIVGLVQTKLILAGKKIESLIDLPLMTDPYKLAAMPIFSSINVATYVSFSNLLPLIVFQQIYLSVKYGNDSASPLAYALYGFILCSELEDIDAGYKFGKLGLNLVYNLNAK